MGEDFLLFVVSLQEFKRENQRKIFKTAQNQTLLCAAADTANRRPLLAASTGNVSSNDKTILKVRALV